MVPFSGESVAESLATLGRQLEQLRATGLTQAEAIAENTRAISVNTQVQSSRGVGTTAVRAMENASKFLGGGLAFMPLVSGLVSLFRGSTPELPPLAPYVAPPALRLDGGVSSAYAGVTPVDYGQDGLPRPVIAQQAAPTTNVTVQVQAMDSRSFLDHSAEIARAVREALLNSHSLNDVINEM